MRFKTLKDLQKARDFLHSKGIKTKPLKLLINGRPAYQIVVADYVYDATDYGLIVYASSLDKP